LGSGGHLVPINIKPCFVKLDRLLLVVARALG